MYTRLLCYQPSCCAVRPTVFRRQPIEPKLSAWLPPLAEIWNASFQRHPLSHFGVPWKLSLSRDPSVGSTLLDPVVFLMTSMTIIQNTL